MLRAEANIALLVLALVIIAKRIATGLGRALVEPDFRE